MADAATPEIIRTYCQYWRKTLLPQFADKAQDELPQEIFDFVLHTINSWERLYAERIKDNKALTLLHGDLHHWNLFYPKNPEIDGLYFGDWETYKRGIGPYDLCYLVGGDSSPQRHEIEKDLLRYYYDGLVDGGVLGYSWEGCVYDYRLLLPSFLRLVCKAYTDSSSDNVIFRVGTVRNYLTNLSTPLHSRIGFMRY